jgi:hypothetical protein
VAPGEPVAVADDTASAFAEQAAERASELTVFTVDEAAYLASCGATLRRILVTGWGKQGTVFVFLADEVARRAHDEWRGEASAPMRRYAYQHRQVYRLMVQAQRSMDRMWVARDGALDEGEREHGRVA